MPSVNLRTLKMTRHPLLVRCLDCDKHVAIPLDKLGLDERNEMDDVSSLKLKCRGCNGYNVERLVTWGAPAPEEWVSRSKV